MTRLFISILLFAWSALFSSWAASQSAHPGGALPDAPAAQNQAQQNSNQQSVQVIILLTRKSYCFPDLATNASPLSVGQKFTLFVENSISGHLVAGSAASAGWGQAVNSPAGFGQGASGYGKRFGAAMARGASNDFFGTFVFASILRQDPRFFVRNSPTFFQAVKYSVNRIVITRADSGADVVNTSGLLGPLAGETLANTYLPPGERSVGSTFSRYASDLGWRVVGNVFREYWPTVSKRLVRPRQSAGN